VFVDPNTQGYIPPNSKFVIAHSCFCSPSVYDFSGLCNSGPIYVVFGNDASWICNTTGGIFGNKPNAAGCVTPAPRYFDLDFTAWGVSSLDPIYSYSPCSLSSGADGDVVLFSPVGGNAITYINSTCVVPLVVLPIELLDFYATKNGKSNEVIWKVAQEENILYYTIEKSNDAIHFTELASVYANSEMLTKVYSIIDNDPYNDITYYRLSTKETNGINQYYSIISVDEKNTKWEYLHYQTEANLVLEFKNSIPKNSTLTLYDLNGKLLVTSLINNTQTAINTQALVSGIYFVQLSTPYKIENFKISISK
jgi:hypothetical protein